MDLTTTQPTANRRPDPEPPGLEDEPTVALGSPLDEWSLVSERPELPPVRRSWDRVHLACAVAVTMMAAIAAVTVAAVGAMAALV